MEKSLTCAARSTLKDVAVESLRAGRQTTSTMRPPDLTTCDCAACGQNAGEGCWSWKALMNSTLRQLMKGRKSRTFAVPP